MLSFDQLLSSALWAFVYEHIDAPKVSDYNKVNMQLTDYMCFVNLCFIPTKVFEAGIEQSDHLLEQIVRQNPGISLTTAMQTIHAKILGKNWLVPEHIRLLDRHLDLNPNAMDQLSNSTFSVVPSFSALTVENNAFLTSESHLLVACSDGDIASEAEGILECVLDFCRDPVLGNSFSLVPIMFPAFNDYLDVLKKLKPRHDYLVHYVTLNQYWDEMPKNIVDGDIYIPKKEVFETAKDMMKSMFAAYNKG